MAPFTDGFVSFGGFKTWYQTAGDLRSRAPLVLLHGGPGIPGNSYAQLMADLADSRPVVRYDQLGCGRSDRPNDPSLWRVETFLDELAALRDALALDDIHLLGHSWGGMLGIEYLAQEAIRRAKPGALELAVQYQFWVEEARRLRGDMPAHIVRVDAPLRGTPPSDRSGRPRVVEVRPGIAPKDVIGRARVMKRMLPLMTSAPVQRMASWASVVPPLRRAAYEIAGMAFVRRHVFRMSDVPLTLCQDYLARNQQVYETMWDQRVLCDRRAGGLERGISAG